MKGLPVICLFLLAAVQAAPTTVPWANIHHIGVSLPAFSVIDVPKNRIIGGSIASRGQFPFQVGFITDRAGFCGGSLISDHVVLTAAHCLENYTSFEMYFGSLRVLDPSEDGRVVVTTTDKVMHENFNFSFGLNNDIALLKTSEPVPFSDVIQPILLPTLRDVDFELVGKYGTTSGWGKIADNTSTISNDMRYVDVLIVDNLECQNAYGERYVPPTKLCVSTNDGTEAPCNGDSGGPLFLDGIDGEQIQVGVVSFGATAGCESGFPDVFTRMTSFLDWIANNGGPAVRP